MKFVENGLLYRGFRPVMWSPVEKTALADAEVEYHEKTSPTIYVKFPLVKAPTELAHTFIVIWTTTPWTIPGNRAIAFSPEISYGLYEIADAADGSLARAGEQSAAGRCPGRTGRQARQDDADAACAPSSADELKSLVAAHPFRSQGYDFDVPVLPGAHVTADTGTGFVHTAPGHGEDDFELMMATFPDYAANNPDAFNRGAAGWQLRAQCAALRGQAHPHARRQGWRRQWRGDQGIDRARQAAGQGHRCAIPIRIAGAPRRR